MGKGIEGRVSTIENHVFQKWVAAHGYLSPQEVSGLVSSMVEAIKRHVKNKETLKEISNELLVVASEWQRQGHPPMMEISDEELRD